MARHGLLTVDAAAEILGLSKPRVYALAVQGKIEKHQIIGSVYISKGSVAAYLKSHHRPEGWLTTIEAMDTANVSRSTLDRLVEQGAILRRKAGHIHLYMCNNYGKVPEDNLCIFHGKGPCFPKKTAKETT